MFMAMFAFMNLSDGFCRQVQSSESVYVFSLFFPSFLRLVCVVDVGSVREGQSVHACMQVAGVDVARVWLATIGMLRGESR